MFNHQYRLHLLNNKKLVGVQDLRGCIIKLDPKETPILGLMIGHSSKSGTKEIGIVNIDDYSIVDCMGYGDTFGPEEDIINAYKIYNTLHNKNLKFVLVFKEEFLLGRSTELQKLLIMVSDLVQNQEELLDGLTWVVTFQRRLLRNNLQNILHQIMNETKLSISVNNIINYISTYPEKIIFIP